MNKKSVAAFVFALILVFLFAKTGQAEIKGTSIYLDGAALAIPGDGQIQIVNESVLLPIRVVAEGLGFRVNWEKQTNKVTIEQKATSLTLAIDDPTALVNGNKVSLIAAPKAVKNTTYVPMRFISEQMGLNVAWDNATKSAYLLSPIPSGSSNNGNEETDSGEVPPAEPSAPPADNDLAKITGIGFNENRLTISADRSVEPNVYTMSGPDRLVVDIPLSKFTDSAGDGLILGSNQSGSFEVPNHPDVSKVRYSLFSAAPSAVRIVIDLNRSLSYTLNNGGDGLVSIDLLPVAPAPGNGSEPNHGTDSGGKRIVVIDAGHGGKAPGSVSVTKKLEKDFNLAVALKVEALLRQNPNLELIMTRTDDSTLSLEDRAKIANEANADLFISIHGNSIDPPANPSGYETHYSREESLALAETMHRHLLEGTGLPDRKIRKQSLYVTRETTMPAVLLEAGYLSNAKDEAVMFTEEFQQRVAQSIVAGIEEYLGLTEKAL